MNTNNFKNEIRKDGSENFFICVFGLGYIGLPTALLFAKKYHVLGYDIIEQKVKNINMGNMPFQEKGLNDLYESSKSNFKATTFLSEIKKCNVFLIAVPTPVKDNRCNMNYVKKAVESISQILKKGDLVILESTVPPKTTTDVVCPILEKSGLKCCKDFSLSFVAEKAIPGNTIEEMIINDRIVGGVDEKSTEVTANLYASFVEGCIYRTDSTTAETAKLMENTFRDVNIALANEFAKICEDIKVDVWKTIDLANKHPRVNIHLPGPGVGGHCIALDPWFLVEKSGNAKIIRTAREINDSMPHYVFKCIKKAVEKLQKPNISILGIAYKKNVDDARETPAEKIIELCLDAGMNVKTHDPHVTNFHYPLYTLNETLKNSDCVVIVTDHDYYKQIDLEKYFIIDTRNFFPERKDKIIRLGVGTEN